MDLISEDDACKISFVMALKDTLNVVGGRWKLAIVCTMRRRQPGEQADTSTHGEGARNAHL